MSEQHVTSLPYLPSPPRLHWGWVLALAFVTFGIFPMIWLVVQGNWVAQIRGKCNGRTWAIVWLALCGLTFVGGIALAVVGIRSKGFELVMRLLSVGSYLAAVFSMKSELENSPINIPLSGVMTFFFGPLYFQYHLQDYDNVSLPLEVNG